MANTRWKPSMAEAAEFAMKMQEIDAFCESNGIYKISDGGGYSFNLNGQEYIVRSRGSARCEKEKDICYIHASKTRIIEIYNDIKAGRVLDGRGYRKGF